MSASLITTISSFYILSIIVIGAVFYYKLAEIKAKYKKCRQDTELAKVRLLLSEMIEIQMFLEQEATIAAEKVIESDKPSYFLGMEQAFRESKFALNKKVVFLQKELKDLKIDHLLK